jgi:regulator of protease activity HflC (stomatin/prohibitin superfamily)
MEIFPRGIAVIVTVITIGVICIIGSLALLYWHLRIWKLPIRPVIIWPTQMAVKVILGEPIEFLNSGLHWIPFFAGCYVVRFPKKLYNLTFPSRTFITMKGAYKGIEYGAQPVGVDGVAYLQFPRNKKLIKILEAEVPTDEVKLMDFVEEVVVGALRVAFGRITWGQAAEDVGKVVKEADEVFRDSDGSLIKVGFEGDDLKLTIKEMRLPKELQAAMPGPDAARLKLEGAGFIAKTRAIETAGTVLEIMAQSSGQSVKDIQTAIAADPATKKEFLKRAQDLVVRQMGIDANAYLDIRVEGGGNIEDSLLAIAAAWQRMPGGKKRESGSETRESKGEPREFKDLTPEDRAGIEEEGRRLTSPK